MSKHSKRYLEASLGVSAYLRKAHMPSKDEHISRMLQDIRETLAQNVLALMESRRMTADSALAKLAGVDQKTVWRIKKKEQSLTIDKLELIARAFGLHAWQLLIPGLDPANPPVFVMSSTEQTFYERMRRSFHEVAAMEPSHKYNVSEAPASERRALTRRAEDRHES